MCIIDLICLQALNHYIYNSACAKSRQSWVFVWSFWHVSLEKSSLYYMNARFILHTFQRIKNSYILQLKTIVTLPRSVRALWWLVHWWVRERCLLVCMTPHRLLHSSRVLVSPCRSGAAASNQQRVRAHKYLLFYKTNEVYGGTSKKFLHGFAISIPLVKVPGKRIPNQWRNPITDAISPT